MTAEGARPDRFSRMRVVLIAVLVLMMLLLGGLVWMVGAIIKPAGTPKAVDVPKGITWVRSIYGFGPKASQQFTGVAHTAIAPDGTIWATDNGNHRVLGFAPDGSFVRALTAKAMVGPSGIAVSSDNEIYVADFATRMIDVFGSNGSLVRAWHTTSNPFQVAVRGDTVAVSCEDGMRIFNTKGELIAKWSSRGRGDEQLDLAQGLAIGEDGTIYVADTHNAKIKAFTRTGKLLWVGPQGGLTGAKKNASDSQDSSDLPVQLTAGMTWDGRGRLVFVDPFSFQIMVADPKDKAKILARYGDSGTEDAKFMYPTGVSYDPSRDWFAVADTANNRVQIVRIPDSGNGLMPSLRRIQVGRPVWICAVPILLLLAALVLLALDRRDRREDSHSPASD